VRSCIPQSAFAPGSRGTKQLETVAKRVIAATGSFYSARGIGSETSVGAAVDEEWWAGKTHLLASLVLAQRERFERIKTYVVSNKLFWNWNGVVRFVSQEVCFDKGFVIWHFRDYCLVQIVSLWSLSVEVQIVFTTHELVDRIKNCKWNASPSDKEEDSYERNALQARFFMKQNAPQARLQWSNKMSRRPDFLTASSWVLCPVNAVCNSFSANRSSESSSINLWIN